MAPAMTAAPLGPLSPTTLTWLLAALLPLILAGCNAGPDHAASQVLEEVLESHRASITGLGAPSPAPSPAPRPAGPAARRPAPGSVASLLGQSPEGVLGALGQPVRRRPEGNAEIWLYQGAHCALDIVLYRDSGAPRVAWAAARASGTESRTEARCLSELASG